MMSASATQGGHNQQPIYILKNLDSVTELMLIL